MFLGFFRRWLRWLTPGLYVKRWLLLLMVAEIATGIYAQGAASIPTLLGEISRFVVISGVLWGTGDLAHLLIDVGHDVRASRVLLARQTYHIAKDAMHDRPFSVERPIAVERVRGEGSPPSGPAPPPPSCTRGPRFSTSSRQAASTASSASIPSSVASRKRSFTTDSARSSCDINIFA